MTTFISNFGTLMGALVHYAVVILVLGLPTAWVAYWVSKAVAKGWRRGKWESGQ